MNMGYFTKSEHSKIFLIVVSILFGIANTQQPLFSDNQNTKLLHGLAKAGYGYLANDWQANTWNPLPTFSYLVEYSYRFFSEYSFYIYYIILNAIFFLSFFLLIVNLFKIKKGSVQYFLILLVLFVIHSELFSVISYQITFYKVSLRDLFTKGVAYQFLNKSYFQPSLFGVLFITSIYFFIKERIYFASFLAAVVVLIHSASIFIAGMLVLSYILILYFRKNKIKESLLVGIIALLIVSPILIQNLQGMMGPKDEMADEALRILVHERIPHHALPSHWFNAEATLQIFIMLVGTLLVIRKEEGMIMATLFTGALVFTLLQIFTKSDQLALIGPWRISVVLIPLSVMVIFGHLVSKLPENWALLQKRKTIVVTSVLLVLLITTVMGGYLHHERSKDYNELPYTALMQFVKENKSERDTYLIPTEMAEFRLITGAPVYITRKSHPYRTSEFMTWYHKVNQVDQLFEEDNLDCKKLDSISIHSDITHLVAPADKNVVCEVHHCIYKDRNYCLYELRKHKSFAKK